VGYDGPVDTGVPVLAVLPLALATACAGDAVLAPVGGGGDGPRPPCESVYTDVPQGECDVYQQDCSPGQACTVIADGADYTTACSPLWGGKGPGEACSSAVECETSLYCVFGRCSPACCYAPNLPCAPDSYCMAWQDYGPYQLLRCGYLAPCELFSPGSCAGAEPAGLCHLEAQFQVSLCMPPPSTGINDEGDLCFGQNQCGEGQACWPGSTPSRCRYNCLLGASSLPGEGGCPAARPAR